MVDCIDAGKCIAVNAVHPENIVVPKAFVTMLCKAGKLMVCKPLHALNVLGKEAVVTLCNAEKSTDDSLVHPLNVLEKAFDAATVDNDGKPTVVKN